MKIRNRIMLGSIICLLTLPVAAATPKKPIISWMPSQYDTGENIKITWNMWWGENGSSWQLIDNQTIICQENLPMNSPNAQTGTCITNFSSGQHQLQVKLCNNDGCTESETKTIIINNNDTNLPPQITLSAPTSTQVGSQINLIANANDSDGNIVSVSFYANDQLLTTDNSSPFQANYIANTLGNIPLSATAIDDQGATSSATVILQVIDCTNCAEPPQVSITIPENIVSGDTVNFLANASDNDGVVTQVSFILDGNIIATKTNAPYQTSWLATDGTHSLVVKAVDNDGLSTSSTPLQFTVNNDNVNNLNPPQKPSISWLPPSVNMVNGKANITVSWNMWYGENGNTWRVLDNNQIIASGELTPNTPNAQSGSTNVAITTAGEHNFTVQLCNISGTNEACSISSPVNVNVVGSDPITGNSPWDYLDNSEWIARKNAGMKGLNKPYNNPDGKMVASYFVEWGVYGRKFYPKDIPVENLTHLIYGFIPICGPNDSLTGTAKAALTSQCANKQDYEVVVHDKFAALEKNDFDSTGKWDDPIKGIFAELYRMKMTFPHIKIIPSIGGWTLSDPLYDIGTNPSARAVFIASVIDFIDTYDFFDGIDIDWEFPGGGGANPALGSAEDGVGFAILMEELRAALDELEIRKNRKYELMAAVSGGVSKVSKIDWERAIKVMDHVNVMTYDYYGAWSQTYGHQTGLYDTDTLATPIDGFTADDAISYLINQRNVPANKLNIGVAKYGRGWEGITGGNEQGPFVSSASGGTPISGSSANGFWEKGIVDYKGIEKNQLGGINGTGANGFKLFWDDTAQASYLWNQSTGTFISFDSERSVKAKGNYVLSKGLGGIFSWEIDADSGTLLNAMHEGLGHTPQQ